MSTGMIVGAVVGGVIGFVIGGPYGAAVGMMIGGAAGAMVDPIQSDISSPGQPEIGDLVVSTNIEGLPISDVLGTTKIAQGNILWYCCSKVEEVVEKQEGGKGGGGSQKVVTGYRHYLSWALGICLGPVDVLYTVFNGADIVWSGELNRPESGGEETISLKDMGSMTFYFGTDDHQPNSYIGSKLADSTLNTPYRYLCWAFFNKCHIGAHRRMPTMKFVVGKFPSFAFSSNNKIQLYDYNPIHAIYYIFSEMLGLPISYLHSGDFLGAATTLKDEGRGVSILFARHSAALTYIESILNHVDCIIRYGIDGKFHSKLLRADESVDDLPSIDENDMLDEPSIERRSWLDTLNEIRVQHTQRFQVGCDCSGVTIGYETLEMGFGDNQMFTVLGVQEECEYFWSIGSGGGTLSEDSGESVQYTAPNVCTGVDIQLSVGGEVCDTINIVVVDCGAAVIGYTTLEMACGEDQTLIVENPVDGCAYGWEVASGGGSLSSGTGLSVVYTAPSTNPSCEHNATIELSCGGVCDTILISANWWTGGEPAYSVVATGCQPHGGTCDNPVCDAWCAAKWCYCIEYYRCDGVYLPGTAMCPGAYWKSQCLFGLETSGGVGAVADMRTSAMIAAGCCPRELF